MNSADQAAERVGKAGGTVLKPAFDVFTAGRMAVSKDPGGAVFTVWQPKDHIGIRGTGEDHTFCWAELATRDTAQAKEFYTKIFGWGAKTDTGFVPYTEWLNGGKPIESLIAGRESQGGAGGRG